MKTLREVANQLDELKMINESLKSNWLRKLISFAKEKGLKVSMKDFITNRLQIRWDKVEDEKYAKEYKAGDSAAQKIARKIAKNEQPGLILVVKNDDVIGAITNGGYMCMLMQYFYTSDSEYRVSQSYANRQYEVVEYAKKFDTVIYTFDKDNDPDKVIIDYRDEDSPSSRYVNKQGIVWQGDTYYYMQIAEKNKKRYADLLAKVKASKEFDEKLGERVKKAVDDVLDLSIDMDKNPEKYTSTYPIESLIEKIYSQSIYDRHERKSRGSNGVLVLWKQYLSYKKSNASYEYDAAKKAKEQLEKLLDKIEATLKENEA